MKHLILSAFFTFSVLLSFSQDKKTLQEFGINIKSSIPKGLKKGDKAPNFSAINQFGKTVELSQVLKSGPVVLVFYRGEWCGYCNKHLAALQDGLENISAAGATVIAVTPIHSVGIQQTISKTEVNFAIVSDVDLNIMRDYDVAFDVTQDYQDMLLKHLNNDLTLSNASGQAVLPVPATYIINQKRKISKVFFDPNYKNRSSAEDILKAIQ
jgi:peroxiredoxin